MAGLFSRIFPWIGGAAVAGSASAAAAPVVEVARQDAWKANVFRVLDPRELAELVAEGRLEPGSAAEEASRSGYNANRLDALVELAQSAPGVPDLLRAWNRDLIDEAAVDRGLAKARILPAYWTALKELRLEVLDPSVVATMVQRGIMPNRGILPVGPPTATGLVPPMPMIDLDPFEEWARSGVSAERGSGMARIVGLPPAPGELLELLRRGKIEEVDYFRGIAEGNTRNEWAPFMLELRHSLLTATQAANLRLRAWIDTPTMHELGALQGYDAATMDRILLGQGRPITNRQVFIGLRRGGVYEGPTTAIDPAFLKSLQESDIRPEWYNLAWSQRHTLPSAFVLRALTQNHDLTQAESEELLLHVGWPEDLAAKVSARWSLGATARAKTLTAAALLDEYAGRYISEAELMAGLTALGYPPAAAQMEAHLTDARRVAKARDHVVAAIEKAYLGHAIDAAEAGAKLADEGIPQPAAGLLLEEWGRELDAARKTLTAAQIKRAFVKGAIDQATALSELEERGYSAADAQTYLAT